MSVDWSKYGAFKVRFDMFLESAPKSKEYDRTSDEWVRWCLDNLDMETYKHYLNRYEREMGKDDLTYPPEYGIVNT